MIATMVRELARARQELAGLVAPVAVPDAVMLFRQAFGPPDPWQEKALTSTAPRLAFNVSRQLGKSSVASALAVHAALSQPGALVLLLSPSLRQSGELFRKVLDCYHAAENPIPPDSETKLTLELVNGSRIVSLPGKEATVRGFSGVNLLLIDEASRCPDELYYSVRPMLAVSHGRLVTLSTPFGMRGFWHKEWTEGEGWERYRVPATDCDRIDPAFLEEERRSLGPLFFASEYLCEFCEVDGSVFRDADIAAALSETVAPLWEAA